MSEVLFYHLTSSSLGQTLPGLLARTLDRGWRAVVQFGDPAELPVMDDLLWTQGDGSFLPHGTDAPKDQPIYLTAQADNPGGAEVAFLVAGARFDPAQAARVQRTCLIFDAANTDHMASAREDWLKVKGGSGLTGTYWAQEDGSWVRKASTDG